MIWTEVHVCGLDMVCEIAQAETKHFCTLDKKLLLCHTLSLVGAQVCSLDEFMSSHAKIKRSRQTKCVSTGVSDTGIRLDRPPRSVRPAMCLNRLRMLSQLWCSDSEKE